MSDVFFFSYAQMVAYLPKEMVDDHMPNHDLEVELENLPPKRWTDWRNLGVVGNVASFQHGIHNEKNHTRLAPTI